MCNIANIKTLADKQHGIVRIEQLYELEVSYSHVKTLIKNHVLTREAKGVYSLSGAQQSWLHQAYKAVACCGRNALLSHESVLMLYGLLPKEPLWGTRKNRPNYRKHQIHVLSPRKEFKFQNVYFHRSLNFPKQNASGVTLGIPHVPIERSIIDCAQQLTMTELDFVLDQAFFKKLTTPDKVLHELIVNRSAPGREKKKLKVLINFYLNHGKHKQSESALELRIERVLSTISNVKLSRQVNVRINAKNYRIDLAIVDKKIAIEIDGYEYHRSPDKFHNDRARQNDLVAAGWTVLRFTSEMTNDQILKALADCLKS